MLTIRHFRESDSASVGRLIADTNSQFNLAFASPEEQKLLLGPFQHAQSAERVHREATAIVIRASMVFVAEEGGETVGVLRGRKERLQSLFVRSDHHRRGIGRALVGLFEQECIQLGAGVVKVAATLYAIPFHTRMGYKKTTGIRPAWSFEGTGLVYRPMKKVLNAAVGG